MSEVIYEGYKLDGIVVQQSISIMHLKAAVLGELGNDEVRKDTEIGHIVEENSCLLKIKNDINMNLYLKVKKRV